jgi:branched-subunit amino acid transport protein
MSSELVLLAVLMGAVTYPSRAIPLLVPGFRRLPPRALEYLRLVGPAVLAAIAAAQVAVGTGADGRPTFHVGVEWLAVAACLALVAWRRNLFLGIVAAVVLVAVLRAAGLG